MIPGWFTSNSAGQWLIFSLNIHCKIQICKCSCSPAYATTCTERKCSQKNSTNFQNYFLTRFALYEPAYPIAKRGHLLEEATIILNFLCTGRVISKLFAQVHICLDKCCSLQKNRQNKYLGIQWSTRLENWPMFRTEFICEMLYHTHAQ